MPLSYLEKNNTELLTYHANPALGLAELPFITAEGSGNGASIIDCTSLGASGGASKQVRIQTYDSDNQSVVFQLWFGDTREAVEAAILEQAAAEIPMMTGSGTDYTMPISTKWMAIDYNGGLSSIQDSTLYVSLFIN